MRSRRASATQPIELTEPAEPVEPAAPAALAEPADSAGDGYRSLSVAEVLSDLPSLDPEQLLLVKSLEEACGGRREVLDRIDDLLAGPLITPSAEPAPQDREIAATPEEPLVRKVSRARPLRARRDRGGDSPAARPVATKPSDAKAARPPRAPKRSAKAAAPEGTGDDGGPAAGAGSVELMDQMGGLLAKDAARRSTPMQTAWPMPALDEMELSAAAAPMAVDETTGRAQDRKERRKAKRRHGMDHHVAPGGGVASPQGALIVPGDGRRSRGRRRGRGLLVTLVVVALVGAGGAVYLKRTQQTPSPAAVRPSAALVATLVTMVPGYQPSLNSTLSATPVLLATAVQDYGSTTVGAVASEPTGFLAGVQRRWNAAGDPSQAVWVFAMEFENPTLASAFATQVASATAAAANQVTAAQQHRATGATQATFATANVPGAIGSTNSVGRLAFARDVFTRGNYVADILVNGPASAGVVAVAQKAAAAQYAALPVH